MSTVSGGTEPNVDPHQEAIAFRDELLSRGWPDAPQVTARCGIATQDNDIDYATNARASGTLLGVWVAVEGVYRYPDFQFDSQGTVRPAVSDLLKALPGDADDRTGWRRAFWLYSPHAQLADETPAELFARNAVRVIEAAKAEFHEQANASW